MEDILEGGQGDSPPTCCHGFFIGECPACAALAELAVAKKRIVELEDQVESMIADGAVLGEHNIVSSTVVNAESKECVAELKAEVEVRADLTDREEADIVLRHTGWMIDFQHVLELAKIMFSTSVVDYGIANSPEGGPTDRSTLVIRPNVLTTTPHDVIHDAIDKVHEFLHVINHDLYMMACVNVSFVPPDVSADVTRSE